MENISESRLSQQLALFYSYFVKLIVSDNVHAEISFGSNQKKSDENKWVMTRCSFPSNDLLEKDDSGLWSCGSK